MFIFIRPLLEARLVAAEVHLCMMEGASHNMLHCQGASLLYSSWHTSSGMLVFNSSA